MNEYKKSRELVLANGSVKLERPQGAYGMRHLARGLWGFWAPPSKRRGRVDAAEILPRVQVVHPTIIRRA